MVTGNLTLYSPVYTHMKQLYLVQSCLHQTWTAITLYSPVYTKYEQLYLAQFHLHWTWTAITYRVPSIPNMNSCVNMIFGMHANAEACVPKPVPAWPVHVWAQNKVKCYKSCSHNASAPNACISGHKIDYCHHMHIRNQQNPVFLIMLQKYFLATYCFVFFCFF